MPPKRASCQICREKESKYTCSRCMMLYCSVPCFKQHKESLCAVTGDAGPSIARAPLLEPEASSSSAKTLGTRPPSTDADGDRGREAPVQEASDAIAAEEREGEGVKSPAPPLRSLTSLNWPYVPEESAFPDPLQRDDPKALQLRQYEAIATSPAVRKALAEKPNLHELLRSIDRLRGESREEALQRALGVSVADVNASASISGTGRLGAHSDEDVRALRQLAEAVEAAVRGGKEDALGLDWGD